MVQTRSQKTEKAKDEMQVDLPAKQDDSGCKKNIDAEIRSNILLVERSVSSLEVRFATRALRATASIRHSLSFSALETPAASHLVAGQIVNNSRFSSQTPPPDRIQGSTADSHRR